MKQRLRNIWIETQFMKKLSNVQAELKKSVAYKKACQLLRSRGRADIIPKDHIYHTKQHLD